MRCGYRPEAWAAVMTLKPRMLDHLALRRVTVDVAKRCAAVIALKPGRRS